MPDTSSSAAYELFAGYVARLEQGQPADLERLCADHPRLADRFRSLEEHRLRVDSVVRKLGASSFEERPEPGKDSEVMRKLALRGPCDRYRFEKEVGRGGQGAIHRVWDEDLLRPLAMKLRRPDSGRPEADSRSLGRFLEEAQVTAQLDHPGIVPVHELGLDPEGRVYFTMKLVRGEDLQSVFAKVRSGAEGWTQTRALGVLLRMCEAMAFAHAKGVIHRDLKPANVMVGRFGEVYVMDWGLARLVGHAADAVEAPVRVRSTRRDADSSDPALATLEGDVMGTPAYMSPEQAEGRLAEMGPHSDVYSAGAMLYELLAGHEPYGEAGGEQAAIAIVLRARKEPPVPLERRAPDAPAELVAICERAMERDPARRYHDMSELAADLSAFLENRVVAAYETGAIAELRKWVRRNRALAGAMAAGILVLTAGLTVSLILKSLAEKRRSEVLQLSALQDLEDLLQRADDLWPVHPQRILEYEAWIDAARLLLDDLPEHRARRDALRARALPRSEEERRQQRLAHQDHERLLRLQGLMQSKRWALEQRRDGLAASVPVLELESLPTDPAVLSAMAWDHVAPQRERFGLEPLGLALARRARELAGTEPAAEISRVLAQASFVLGRDDEALDAAFLAQEEAPANRRQEAERFLAALEQSVAEQTSPEALQRAEQELEELAGEVRLLDQRIDERRDWRFADDDEELRWWDNQLTKLIIGLVELEKGLLGEGPGSTSPDRGWSIPRRLELARSLRQGSAPGGEQALAWEKALPDILATYPRIVLEPQLGLVPIGPDPQSGFWEFADIQTGQVPRRRTDGTLEMREDSALVMVLIPGGTFVMGAQNADRDGPGYDPQAHVDESPPHEVTLEAYFLSKYEMTQAQWLHVTGENPSAYRDSLLNPVEQVTWYRCQEVCRRLGLALPSEAQWEYAARAGTSTPWWTGSERGSLRDRAAANLADRTAQRGGADWEEIEEWLEDGYAVHAPVGRYAPNPFGLHDVHGNVFEWCLDGYYREYYANSPRFEPLASPLGSINRVYRGGSFYNSARKARSSQRLPTTPESADLNLGLRPVRLVERRPDS